jgi:hypothetical protein
MDGGGRSVLLVLEPDPDLDPAELDRLTRRLRAEIAALDVESVTPVPGVAAPPGARWRTRSPSARSSSRSAHPAGW